MLPAVVERFSKQYPDVSLHIHQGSPTQIHDALISGEVDLAITTEAPYLLMIDSTALLFVESFGDC